MDPPTESHDEKIAKYVDITQQTEHDARIALNKAEWNLNAALEARFPGQSSTSEDGDVVRTENPTGQRTGSTDPFAGYTGDRTVAGRPAPYAESSGSRPQPARPSQGTNNNFMSFQDLSDESHHAADHDDHDHNRGDLFAGGEKSGLAVQDPEDARSQARRITQDILNNAKRSSRQAGPSAAPGPSSSRNWHIGGQTLGGDGVESVRIPATRGAPIPRFDDEQSVDPRPVAHTFHVWDDGFSINEGPLFPYGQGNNNNYLSLIKDHNRVPRELIPVDINEEVEVAIQEHYGENWHQLPYVYRPFSGQGRRLGSPVPGDISSSLNAATAAGDSRPPTVDESQPILTIRIQLPNGTRVPARFNTTHTVGDIYGFVQQSSPETRSRNWVLATTFPNKEHVDRNAVLGEMDEFKRGGTAVVKWV